MKISSRVASLPGSGIRRFFDLAAGTSDVISLGVGEPEGPTPWVIRDHAIHALRQGWTHYTSNRGIFELRESISRDLNRLYGVDYSPETQLLVTCGVSQAFDLALRCLVEPGDDVLIVEPAYVAYNPLTSLAGGNVIAVPASSDNGYSVKAADVASAITPSTRVIVLNYPNNPTGAVLPKKNMEKIAKLAIEYDLTVISDEVYSRLTYEGEHTCFASLPEMNERTVLLNGFSKSYSMTGWRVGYLCGPAQIVEAALRVNQYAELSAPTVAQHAAIEALKNGEESLNRNVSQLDQLRRYTCSRLDEIGLTFSRPAGAFFVFPDVSTTGLDGEEFALRLLSEQKVVVIPGNIFGNGCENRVRITYANTQKTMRDALDRIEAFVKNL